MSEHALILALALALDALIGEPRALWSKVPHPVVVMGRVVTWLDRTMNRGAARRTKGVIAVALMGAAAILTGLGLSILPLGKGFELAAATVLLAQRSLVDHVGAVASALGQSIEEGRQAVSMIVGRHTAELDEAGVARAAIESAAENLSDGVIAPAFWFLVAGAPGILFYKIINTADSMIGHRTERHRQFGWAAARLDDVLNWVPARLTAALIALVSTSLTALRRAAREGPRHRSVNAGWPEAAMAHVLGIALSGPRRYGETWTDDAVLNPDGRRDAHAADIRAAVGVLWRVWATLLIVATGLALV